MDDLASFAAGRLDSRVRQALARRGVTEEQIVAYQVGHLQNSLPDVVPRGFRQWAREKIDDVLLFPLTTVLGEIRGFQIRNVERAKAGYSDYLPDKREACVFGLGQAAKSMWETRSAFLVEGAFDLFPVVRGYGPVIATLTARAQPTLVRLLSRMVDRVWVGYDMDEAGRRGCAKFERDHRGDFEVYIVAYPEHHGVKDPAELWEALGEPRFLEYVQSLTHPRTPFD